MYCRNTKSRGGVAVYVKEGVSFQKIDVSHMCQESDLEIVCAKTKFKANADSIAAAPNQCKRAWELISNSLQRRKPMSPEVDQLTPEIFSNFFASSVEEVRSSTGSSVTTAMLYLQNMPRTVSANFKLKKVSYDDVIKIVKNLKPSKCRDIFDISCDLVLLISNSTAFDSLYKRVSR
ncbi:hypothetical protein J6590_058550 [Homalodisca vitripennis]|nr:hypothetical protein J6590_058550 [Homalodisca vitripennis]